MPLQTEMNTETHCSERGITRPCYWTDVYFRCEPEARGIRPPSSVFAYWILGSIRQVARRFTQLSTSHLLPLVQ